MRESDDVSKQGLVSLGEETVVNIDSQCGPPFTHFSGKSWVREDNGWLVGHWGTNFAAACSGSLGSKIPLGAVIDLQDVGTCPSGEVVVKCVHY